MLKVAGFFAGAGGIELGFKEAGFDIIYANEINKNAALIYEANFKHKVDIKDIKDVEQIPQCDVIVGGFPCQSFSYAGKRLGFDDRQNGNCFFELARIINFNKPRAFMLENVKGLVHHDKGKTLEIIKKTLEDLGYYLHINIYNAKEYANIPQNRERVFIVGFLEKKAYLRFKPLEKIPLTKKLDELINFGAYVEEEYYINKFNVFKDDMQENRLYIYAFNELRTLAQNIAPCLLASMGCGGGKKPFLKTGDNKIRELSPKECFNLQGYPVEFVLPTNVSKAQSYKAAGNSVVVPLIKRIALSMKEVLK